MKTRATFILLTSDRLVLAAYDSAGALRRAEVAITLNQEPGQWVKELGHLCESLKQLADELAVDGAPAHVLYIGPTQAVALESLPVKSTAQAIEAATLSCLETVSYASASAVCETLAIGRDAARKSDFNRRTHVAVTVDRDDILGAIARWVEGAGLRFISAIPVDGPLLAQLAERGLTDVQPMARLYIGQYSSLFVISADRSLLFARRIGLGIESMVNVLTRPIRIRSGVEPVTLSEDQARAILLEHGLPDRDTVVHHEPELRGAQIIPVLQPVLQRIVVELRQSMRFSLPEEIAGSVPIACLGPGRDIPGLARVIAEELGVPQVEDDATAVDDESGDMLADAVRDRRILRHFALLPTAHRRVRQRMKLQRWLWAGAAAALIMVAVDGVRQHAAVESLRTQQATMLSHHSELDAFQRTSTVLAGALREMSQIEQQVADELFAHFDGHAALIELGSLTPESILLTTITFRQDQRGVTGTINGIAMHDADQQTALKDYVARIRQSPLFDDAVLGNVRVGYEDGHSGERFEATLSLAEVPRPELIAEYERQTAQAANRTGGES